LFASEMFYTLMIINIYYLSNVSKGFAVYYVCS
jgi:hypothetical protein